MKDSCELLESPMVTCDVSEWPSLSSGLLIERIRTPSPPARRAPGWQQPALHSRRYRPECLGGVLYPKSVISRLSSADAEGARTLQRHRIVRRASDPSDQQFRNLLDPVAPGAPRASTDGHRCRTQSAGCVDDPPGADWWFPARVRWHPVLLFIRDFLSPMFYPDPGQRRGPVLPPGRHPSLGRSEPGCRVPAPPRVRRVAG